MTLKKKIKGYDIGNIRCKYMASYLMAIITMLALALTVYEIFAKQMECKKVYLENDSQWQGVENATRAIWLENVQFYIAEFSELYLPDQIHLLKRI